jgi:hypothetical protein
MNSFSACRCLGSFFFVAEQIPLPNPIRPSIAPKVEEDFEKGALKRTQLKNMKTN